MIILMKKIFEKNSGHEDQRSIEIEIAELQVLIFKNNGTLLSSSSFREKLKFR